MSTPEVAVVVATRDRAERLDGLLRSLRAQTVGDKRFEVIVVDDGSTDDTAAVLHRHQADGGFRLTAMRQEPPGGPAAARNVGWRRAAAPLVAFTDDDCEAEAGWLEALLGVGAGRDDAIVQGPTTPIPRERHIRGVFARTKVIDGPSPWFQTCNVAYPRTLLERLGGFDDGFPEAFGEDTDLGWRALAAGASHEFAPDAHVYHAVERLHPLDHLRTALRGSDVALAFRRHPGLRHSAIRYRAFRNPNHAKLLLAIAGLALSRRLPPAVLLALPYAVAIVRRARDAGATPLTLPYLVLYDSLQTYSAARGCARHGVLAL
jgi:glycosyltransferase involved in cell wall biosynthesis